MDSNICQPSAIFSATTRIHFIMAKLKIKNWSLPERCEVCHKSDRFDPEKGYCDRCKNISAVKVRGTSSLDNQRRTITQTREEESQIYYGDIQALHRVLSALIFGPLLGVIFS